MNLKKLAAGMVLLAFSWGCSVVIPPISSYSVKPLNSQSAEQQAKDNEKCSKPPDAFYLDGVIIYLIVTGGLGIFVVAKEWERDQKNSNKYYKNCMISRGYQITNPEN